MIKLLRINNIALIPRLEVELGPGLTLLTGETGAGKSILIDALGLVLGDRSSADLIRSGEERAAVEALAEGPALARFLEEHGLPAEGDEVVVRREIHASGKGKATVNGALVPAGGAEGAGPAPGCGPRAARPPGPARPRLAPGLSWTTTRASIGEPVQALYLRLREVEGSARPAAQGPARGGAPAGDAGLPGRGDREGPPSTRTRRRPSARRRRSRRTPGRLATLSERGVRASLRRGRGGAEPPGPGVSEGRGARDDRSGVRPVPGGTRDAVLAQLEDLALFLRDYRERVQVSPGGWTRWSPAWPRSTA